MELHPVGALVPANFKVDSTGTDSLMGRLTTEGILMPSLCIKGDP